MNSHPLQLTDSKFSSYETELAMRNKFKYDDLLNSLPNTFSSVSKPHQRTRHTSPWKHYNV